MDLLYDRCIYAAAQSVFAAGVDRSLRPEFPGHFRQLPVDFEVCSLLLRPLFVVASDAQEEGKELLSVPRARAARVAHVFKPADLVGGKRQSDSQRKPDNPR